ncbi:MAG TPA: insulinase family protein, partial [Polyangiaceae bacterium]|nr:insulinase family protein [Polyangiaceae bacterium]
MRAAGGAAALLLGLGARGAAASSPSCDDVERFTLKNGIQVVLARDAGLPSVALVSSIHAGSRDDPPGYEGLAHYVEHLTLRAAPPFASALALYEQAGAVDANAA